MRGWKGIAQRVLDEAGVTEVGDTVYIPYCCPGGREHNSKSFRGSSSWWQKRGMPQILFGLETLPRGTVARACVVLVCEGESDALAARELLDSYGGLRAERWVAVGCPGAGAWKPAWADHLRGFPRIYVCGDGDRPGRGFNHKVRADLPWARIVAIPDGEDLRSLVQRDRAMFFELLDQADADTRLDVAVRLGKNLDDCERLLHDTAFLSSIVKEGS